MFDYERRRRFAAPRRARDGDHHPRPGAAADDRLRGRVAATTARTRVPELIAEALAGARPRDEPPAPRAAPRGRRGVDAREPPAELTVGRGVIDEMVRLAAFEVPGVLRVGRGGPALARAPRRPRGPRPRPRRRGSTSASGSSPARASRSSRSPRRSGRRSAPPSSGCSA